MSMHSNRANELSERECNHYQRHLSLPEVGIEGQLKLRNASVLVVGAGGLGCPVLQYLTAVGVGRIGILDNDYVDASNLQRQVLFSAEDVGKFKAEIASQKLSQNNPFIVVDPIVERLNNENVERIFRSYSIVVDGSDNFETRYLVNDACVMFRKVLIYGSIFQFHGQVSVFNYQKGPTYRCLFPESPGEAALPNCSEVGVLGALPGVIGSIQALETIKIITGVGQPLSGKVLLYDALSQKTQTISLQSNPGNQRISVLPDSKNQCPSMNKPTEEIKEISPKDLKMMLKNSDNLHILDVRERWERDQSRIEPSVHFPLAEFSSPTESFIASLPMKNSKVIVYCKAGIRSMHACKAMSSWGFNNLHNLMGGIDAWEKEDLMYSMDQ